MSIILMEVFAQSVVNLQSISMPTPFRRPGGGDKRYMILWALLPNHDNLDAYGKDFLKDCVKLALQVCRTTEQP
jgi:hypothetical protein